MKKFLLILLGTLLMGCAQFTEQLVIKSTYDGDEEMWNHIFEQNSDFNFKSTPRGAILPHHLIDAPDIAGFYRALSKEIDPSVIVVIAPNHYQNGASTIQTCRACVYQTTVGPLAVDSAMVNEIVVDGVAQPYDQTFIKEHGIYNHAPFIKKFFPEARIFPITLKWETTPQETIELSNWLDDSLPRNAFVIASVDFSHYIPVEAANFHDVSSYATIKNFDYANIFDLEIDSPPSISTIMYLMKKMGAEDVERLLHTNNQDFHPERIEATTSHQFIAFYRGEKQFQKNLTILSVGNIDPAVTSENDGYNKGLGWYDSYRWDITQNGPATGVEQYLRDIKDEEDRFLVGADLLIFNLIDDHCFSHEQNGLKVSLCEFNQDGNRTDQMNLVLEQKKAGAYVIYILYQFSDSQLTADDKKIANDFVSAGATIFVGRGVRTVLPIENYGDHLIVYSLGDFISDPALKKSVGEVLGISLEQKDSGIAINTYNFPVDITNGYPKRIPQPLPF